MNTQGILSPLSPSTVGEDIRPLNIYDELKELRREDDHNISYGIWEHELKIPHWEKLESSTLDILKNTSKDLEVLTWYIESTLQSKDLSVLSRHTNLLIEFMNKFWDSFFPIDPEHRISILESLDRKISVYLMQFDLCESEDFKINLTQWKKAHHMQQLIARQPYLEDELREEHEIDLDTIRNRLSLNSQNFNQFLEKEIQVVESNFRNIIKIFDSKTNNSDLNFGDIFSVIQDINHILERETKSKIAQKQNHETEDDFPEIIDDTNSQDIKEASLPTSQTNGSVPIKNRDDVYGALGELSNFLQQTEPHSPAPHILQMLVNWKDKSLPEIIADVHENPSEYRILKAIVGS